VGSTISESQQIDIVLSEMRKYRGGIEGGAYIRRFENLVQDSETRYFVLNGKAHAPMLEAPIPEIVTWAAQRISSTFFSYRYRKTPKMGGGASLNSEIGKSPI